MVYTGGKKRGYEKSFDEEEESKIYFNEYKGTEGDDDDDDYDDGSRVAPAA